jgi:hypothetical protein
MNDVTITIGASRVLEDLKAWVSLPQTQIAD